MRACLAERMAHQGPAGPARSMDVSAFGVTLVNNVRVTVNC